METLAERAKELDCLYQVEELLNNPRLSLPEIFAGVIRVIPAGWQYPEICQARIVYDNASYQSPGFRTTPWVESCPIKVEDKVLGSLEVSYTAETPRREEGIFLDKERKLISAIADRMGQTILSRKMERLLREWEMARSGPDEIKSVNRVWGVMLDILQRTDPGILPHLARKMRNHLSWRGIKCPAEEAPIGEQNSPSARSAADNAGGSYEELFKLAAEHLSDEEITVHLRNWIRDYRAYSLIRTINRVDPPLSEIVEAIAHDLGTTGAAEAAYSSMDRWIKIALIRRFLFDQPDMVRLAKQHLEIRDFHDIAQRIIFPPGSHGKLGGKSAGLFLAEKVLAKAAQSAPELGAIKVPKSWYITTDAFVDFLHYNNLDELNEYEHCEPYEIRLNYPQIVQMMKKGRFSPGIVKSLAMALDDFGDSPLIVRSSSLLEDRMGMAFFGKYKSLFLANQGDKRARLEALMDAVAEVYASTFSPDAIQYRAERGLLDAREEMGILLQEVVGTRIGRYYMPLCAGVAFSNNEFRWSPRIKRGDGLVRLVPGLGTRAVDRLSDDFPIIISPGQPGLRANAAPGEIRRYAPKSVDLIDLERGVFQTMEISALLRECGEEIPGVEQIFSLYREDHLRPIIPLEFDGTDADLVVTFEGLLSRTAFVKQIKGLLATLQEKLTTPVDIEFALDGRDFYLLQCRPQSSAPDSLPAPIPKDIPRQQVIFSANRHISNGRIPDLSYLVYVVPEEYGALSDLGDLLRVGKAIGALNAVLPKRQFVLMGPGRWGSRGDIKLGVQVTYADLNNTAVLIEVARKKGNYQPELSFGTHFFQDLVESGIRYLPLYPDDSGVAFNEPFLTRSANILAELLPDYADLAAVVRVIDVPASSGGKILRILMNADLGEALGYLAAPGTAVDGPEAASQSEPSRPGDNYWRWRFYLAERLAAQLDPERFGVEAVYVFGSTNNATAGPGSDIDLIVHFRGTDRQREELLRWLEGWSLCLAEVNYLKTGYESNGLLDVHLITDEDIAKRTAFAVKIGAVTDPAHRLKLGGGLEAGPKP